MQRVTPVIPGYHLQHLFPRLTPTIRSMPTSPDGGEQKMRKIAAALLMAGGLAMAGQASAHDGGDIVGALIGGAVIGAVISSALNPPLVVAYQAPGYAPPAYQQQAYTPPPGYCYNAYQGGYVACSPPPAGQYGYAPAPPQPGW
jgi:hypothetical protein